MRRACQRNFIPLPSETVRSGVFRNAHPEPALGRKGDFSRFAADFDSDACSFEEAAEAVAQSGDWSPIWEWATKDLKWSDVAGHAIEVKGPDPLSISDFEDAWVNGIWDISPTEGDAA